ncbi:hypothetical protein DUHN55_34560 [Helicobacter pylori]
MHVGGVVVGFDGDGPERGGHEATEQRHRGHDQGERGGPQAGEPMLVTTVDRLGETPSLLVGNEY